MDDSQLLRYSRHILLDEIGIDGQQRLLAGRVLILGAGGLGSIVAMYLGAAGVGELVIADGDCVEVTNLQRQLAHDTARIGMNKAESASRTVSALNPNVLVQPVQERLAGDALTHHVERADVVVDCCDNFSTRYAVNRACFTRGKPLVSGAAVSFSGQATVFDFRNPLSPCYACVYPEASSHENIRCALMGVFSPLVGMIGSIQAAEAMRCLAGMPGGLVGRMQMVDSREMAWTEVGLRRNLDCTVCGMR